MDFKAWLPTVEKPGSTLTHATAAFAFPLTHNVVPDDLKCSATLWETDPNNPNVEDHMRHPQQSWIHTIHALRHPAGIPMVKNPLQAATWAQPTLDIDPEVSNLAWHFCYALVTFGIPFKLFQSHLGTPRVDHRYG